MGSDARKERRAKSASFELMTKEFKESNLAGARFYFYTDRLQGRLIDYLGTYVSSYHDTTSRLHTSACTICSTE